MLDARQIRDSEFIKNGVKRRARAEAQQFLERTAASVEQLQNENASVRAENIELAEYNARLTEMNEKLENEKEQLLQKLSGAVEFPSRTAESEEISDIAQDGDYASLCAENSELIEYNTRLREVIEKLEDENDQMIAKLAEAQPESDGNQQELIAAARAENIELTEYIARLKEVNATLEDEKEQLLQKLAESQPESDGAQPELIAAVRDENSELSEYITRLKENNATLQEEKEQLLQKLAEATMASKVEPMNESEQIIRAAQENAKSILEKAERDYLLKMTRANAAITQKTIAFEMEFGDNLRKLKAVDAEVRQSKAQFAKLLEQMPDGIGENTEAVLDRLKNQQ